MIYKNIKILDFLWKKPGMYKALVITIFLALLTLPLAGCNTINDQSTTEEGLKETNDGEIEKIIVTLDWTPNTNHTGLFIAKDMDYYLDEGLNVEIIQLSGGTVEQVTAAGSSHFGVSYQEAVTFARMEDVPIVSIGAIIQHNTSGFASLKEKGIETPKDFEGKRYGGWGSPVEEATIKHLMELHEADYEKVDILTTGAVDFFAASEKDADFFWIFYGWDGIAAELRDIELNYIQLGDIDPALDYYTPVIITGEKLINENPELVARFMRATTKGYQMAESEPLKAAEILMNNAPELDREMVIASQKWLKDWYRGDSPKWGFQKDEVWKDYARWLYENKLVEKMPDVNGAFTNEYIN